MTELIEISGCTIAVRKNFDLRPETPVLIFLHEGLGSIEFWKDFPELMSELTGLPFLVYDRPGYGKSDPLPYKWKSDYHRIEAKKYLRPLLEIYGIKRPALIGHSDGGTIALLYASESPSHAEAVVTIGSHVFNDEVTTSSIGKALEAYEKGNLRRKLTRFHEEKTDDIFFSWAKTWLSEENRGWDIRHEIKNISCPVLAIEGEEDPYSAGDQATETAKACVGESILLPGIRHSPQTENPVLTSGLIKDFLQRSGIINKTD